MRLSAGLIFATSIMAFAAMPAAVSADDFGDTLGTTQLIGILGGINLPQTPVPDPNATDPNQGGANTNTTPTPAPSQPTTQQPPPTTHALGYYCKEESKRHVKGQKRTPFSQCVTAMAKLSKGTASAPAAACRALGRRHVAGAPSTPFALCIAGAKQLLADQGK